MRLARHPALDALCGEYMLGTLRGPARRRFERAARDEPMVALRMRMLEREFTPLPAARVGVAPPAGGFARIARDLALPRRRWYDRIGVWRAWAVAATAVLVLALGLTVLRPAPETASYPTIATLSGGPGAAPVTASLSQDGRTLVLRAARPVEASRLQSYELWLLPASGAAPVSMAVLGSLDARITLRDALVGALRSGAKLAISVEPAGGSPTGGPTGPVILSGPITS
jgi:anti-sigma-K factor RskA